MNAIRWLSGQTEVLDEPQRNYEAQGCALIMNANEVLTHNPPEHFACHTTIGALGAQRSNICSCPGLSAVDVYMIDPGANNEIHLGH